MQAGDRTLAEGENMRAGRKQATERRWTAAPAVVLLLLGMPLTAFAADPPPTLESCDLTPVADGEAVFVQTPLGAFQIELYSNVAPQTVANFRGYISRGDYDDSLVHRIVPDFVMQTGGFRSRDVFFEPVETQPDVPNEPCISNVAGTIAMAKLEGQPNSANSQWFVNLVDNTGLDSANGGFTAFGRVRGHGLSVPTAISLLTTKVQTDPVPPFLAAVPMPLWSFFRASPVTQQLDLEPGDSGDYGCFDPDQAGILLAEDPQSFQDWEPNEALGLEMTLVSTACEPGGGAAGPPSVACTDPEGRRVLLMDSTGGFFGDPDAPFNLAEQVVSCDGLAASEASLTARLEALGAQLDLRFIKLQYSVPEPGSGIAGAVALFTLYGLRRGRNRRR